MFMEVLSYGQSASLLWSTLTLVSNWRDNTHRLRGSLDPVDIFEMPVSVIPTLWVFMVSSTILITDSRWWLEL